MTINRRALVAGTTALAAPALLHRSADAAEFNWKFATDIPPTHPSNSQARGHRPHARAIEGAHAH